MTKIKLHIRYKEYTGNTEKIFGKHILFINIEPIIFPNLYITGY